MIRSRRIDTVVETQSLLQSRVVHRNFQALDLDSKFFRPAANSLGGNPGPFGNQSPQTLL